MEFIVKRASYSGFYNSVEEVQKNKDELEIKYSIMKEELIGNNSNLKDLKLKKANSIISFTDGRVERTPYWVYTVEVNSLEDMLNIIKGEKETKSVVVEIDDFEELPVLRIYDYWLE